eukprot:GHVU01131678.1.p1 GENE.GHVU01131678.1~~GHVU01131678.1.p1  ORF type:complete len:703 (+),score=137.32 GHVU01131678.1:1178-3286(+)
MSRRCVHLPSSVTWVCMDVSGGALSGRFSRNSFSAVIDKGFLDAHLSMDAVEQQQQQQQRVGGAANAADSAASATVKEKVPTGDPNAPIYKLSDPYLRSVMSLLKKDGVYLLVSLCQHHVVKALAMYFKNKNVVFAVFPLNLAATKGAAETAAAGAAPGGLPPGPSLIPYVVIIKKLQEDLETPLLGGAGIRCHVAPSLDVPAQTVSVFALARTLDQVSRAHLERNVYGSFEAGRQLEVLVSPAASVGTVTGANSNRYRLLIYDHTKCTNGRTAAFIAPPGRDSDWLVATAEGNEHLADAADVQRLVVVTFPSNTSTASLTVDTAVAAKQLLEETRSDVEAYVSKFVLPASAGKPVPVLAVNDVPCHSEVVFDRFSQYNGRIVVRDVYEGRHFSADAPADAGDTAFSREMLFDANPRMSQTIVPGLRKPGGEKELTPADRLACLCHEFFIAAMCLLPDDFVFHDKEDNAAAAGTVTEEEGGGGGGVEVATVSIMGLGGGALPTKLDFLFGRRAEISCVELDPVVVDATTTCYCLPSSVKVVVGDALAHTATMESGTVDVFVVDVSATESSGPIACPTPDFLKSDYLRQVSRVLKPAQGVLMLNLVCRSSAARQGVVDALAAEFPVVLSFKHEQDVNEAMICLAHEPSFSLTKSVLAERLSVLGKNVTASEAQWRGTFESADNVFASFRVIQSCASGQEAWTT